MSTGKKVTIKTGKGSGTDQAGADLEINGGSGTGTGDGGSIIFQIAEAGTTGSSLNSATAAVTITKGKALQIHPNNSSYSPDVSNKVDIDFSQIGDRIIQLSTGGDSFSLTGSNVTAASKGQQGSIVLINPSSAAPTVTWEPSNVWYFDSGGAINIPTTNDLIHIFSYYICDVNKVLITGATGFSQYT